MFYYFQFFIAAVIHWLAKIQYEIAKNFGLNGFVKHNAS